MARLMMRGSLSRGYRQGMLAICVIMLALSAVGGSMVRPGGMSVSAATTQMDKVTLAMGYIPSVQFAPFYVAQARGYYRAAHLDVTFDYGSSTDLLKAVGTGRYAFANSDSDGVIAARASGVPVRYIAAEYQRFPIVVFALASSHINTAADLRGKTIGLPGLYGSTYIGLLALLRHAGLGPKDVHLVSIGYTQASSVISKHVQAAVTYAMNEPVLLRAEGYSITVLPVADAAHIVGAGLITSDSLITSNPDLVSRFVHASLAGLRDTLANPTAAFTISRKQMPTLNATEAQQQFGVLKAALAYWHVAGQSLGYAPPAAWTNLENIMRAEGQLTHTVPVNDLFTNQFIK